MDLALRFDEDAAEEEDHAAYGKDECRDELYVEFLFHIVVSLFLVADATHQKPRCPPFMLLRTQTAKECF